MKILIIEDNPVLRENLAFLLKKMYFVVELSENGKQAIEKTSMNNYDAIVLDVNMPLMDGKQFLSLLRAQNNTTPVIALTSNSMLEDKLEMFDLGVDDYLTKPFEVEELAMRLKALGKRGETLQETTINIGNICIDLNRSMVYVDKKQQLFSHKQYLIIEYLAKNAGYPKNKLQIMEYVWGEAEENLELSSTTLESHIYAIRKKLGKNFIQTLKGVGYIIEKNENKS